MANIGGLLGTAGGVNGTGISAPSTGNIVGTGQLNQANTEAQNALTQQQAFANAVAPGGTAALASQQQLLNQLQQGANGQGPNPALAQLNQTTGQNVANQAALMAGQRGSSQNAGLIARQAAQQGAATQQQAAGQAATLSAQQQIAYMQQLQAQQAQMVGQQAGATNAYTQSTQNQQLGLTNAAAGLQESTNSANAALAGQSMQQQSGLLGGIAGGVGSAVSSLFANGGQVQMADGGSIQNSYNGEMSPSFSQVQTQSGPKSFVGQFFSGMSNQQGKNQAVWNKLGSNLGNWIAGNNQSSESNSNNERSSSDTNAQYLGANVELDDAASAKGQSWDPDDTQIAASNDSPYMAAHGGKVPALVSPGEQYIPPKEVKKVAAGKKDPLKAGQRIPGKPKFPGNDYRNDVVPKTLEEGGIVIPNKIMQSKNPHWEAMKFVHATVAKNKGKVK